MLKFRTNLRIVVAIVACLAVTTMFASCDKDKDGDDDGGGTPSGKIDQKLVGMWALQVSGFVRDIEFKSNGTYYSIIMNYSYGVYNSTHMRGNYSANDGIYTLTKLETDFTFIRSKQSAI